MTLTTRSRSYNAFSCKCISSLTIGHINFKLHRCIGHIILKVLSYILYGLDPKVKVIGKKAGICDGVPSTAALVIIHLRFYFKILCVLTSCVFSVISISEHCFVA